MLNNTNKEHVFMFEFAFEFCICILHFKFKFPAKNSEFFRFIYLNFPPKKLDVIVVVVVGGGGRAHTDSRGISSIGRDFSAKPIYYCYSHE